MRMSACIDLLMQAATMSWSRALFPLGPVPKQLDWANSALVKKADIKFLTSFVGFSPLQSIASSSWRWDSVTPYPGTSSTEDGYTIKVR